MSYNFFVSFCCFALFLVHGNAALCQTRFEVGRKIFQQSCINCHAADGKNSLGSPFKGLKGNALNHSDEWLAKWTENPMKLIAEKNKEAIAAYNRGNKLSHPAFPFKKVEMESLILYLKTLK